MSQVEGEEDNIKQRECVCERETSLCQPESPENGHLREQRLQDTWLLIGPRRETSDASVTCPMTQE